MYGIDALTNVDTQLTDNTFVTVIQEHCCATACRFGSMWSDSYAGVDRAACMHLMTHVVQVCLGLCVPQILLQEVSQAARSSDTRFQIALIATSPARCAAFVKLTNWGSVMTRACTCNHVHSAVNALRLTSQHLSARKPFTYCIFEIF